MPDCIFCKIVAGEIPAVKVYEDENVLAFMDIIPIREGHTLVIPKKHEPDFQHLDDETYRAVMAVTKKLAERIEKELKPMKVGLMVSGFDVPHTHIHIVPMQNGLDIASKQALDGLLKQVATAELEKTAEKIRLN